MQIQELLCKSIISQTYPQDFLERINPAGTLSSEGALKVYLQGYIARLTESLGEKYEAVWAVLGDKLFFEISKDYILKNPTHLFNINNYGNEFSLYLKNHSIIHEFPFLEDLANFEKSFFEVFHWPNELEVDLTKLQMSEEDFYINFINLAFCENSNSIFEIWKDRTEIKDSSQYEWSNHEFLLLFKNKSKVSIQKLNSQQFKFLKLLQSESFYISIEKLGQSIDEGFISDFFKAIGSFGIIKNIEIKN